MSNLVNNFSFALVVVEFCNSFLAEKINTITKRISVLTQTDNFKTEVI